MRRYLELNQGRRWQPPGCQGTPPRDEIEVRDGSRLEDATKAAYDALACRYGNGPIKGRIRAHGHWPTRYRWYLPQGTRDCSGPPADSRMDPRGSKMPFEILK
jgi:hypothetical protein